MGLFDRLSRVVRANLNDMIENAENPEAVLEQAIINMQEDLIQLRQAVTRAIATQKRTEQQYKKNQTEANNWQNRAELALSKGDENLAREALIRKKAVAEAAAKLETQLEQQTVQVEALKKNLIALESKISEAKTKKDRLKSRAAAAKANEQLRSRIGRLGTDSAMAAFERMEDKVLEIEGLYQTRVELPSTTLETRLRQLERELEAMRTQLLDQQAATGKLLKQNSTALEQVRSLLAEARSQSLVELSGHELEQQFAMLESSSDIDDELVEMKAPLVSYPVRLISLPDSVGKTSPSSNSAVDAELDALREQIDNL